MDRVILHSDMNSFYASVECRDNPDYRRVPMVVGGSEKSRHGIVLAKNPMAKAYGIQTGEALWAARERCPNLVVCPPDYKKYMKASRQARRIYARYSDRIEPFGPDEAWIDLSGCPALGRKSPGEVAFEIKETVKRELGLTVSIGVSFNKIFAKFGSDYKKPDAVTVIGREDVERIIYPSPVEDLLGVGRATKKKFNEIGVFTVGDLARLDPSVTHGMLGKNGDILWLFANGEDQSPVKPLNEEKVDVDYAVKSVGNSLTAPRDLVSEEEVKLLIYMLAESVGVRLRRSGFMCSGVEIHLRDHDLFGFTRQRAFRTPTRSTGRIAREAFSLYQENYQVSRERSLRSIGVRAIRVRPDTEPVQLSMLESAALEERETRLDLAMDKIRSRFGNLSVRRGVTLGDEMSALDFARDHNVHPVGYFA